MRWEKVRTVNALRGLKARGLIGYDSESCYWQHRSPSRYES
jgi:hypothetical protein